MKNLETLAAVYIYIYIYIYNIYVISNKHIIKYYNSKGLCVLTMFNMHSSLPP